MTGKKITLAIQSKRGDDAFGLFFRLNGVPLRGRNVHSGVDAGAGW